MKKWLRSWMPALAGMTMLLSLSGCGCVIDPGDSTSAGAYVDGCWSAARRDNRR